jgi:hypothetical protein
LVEQRTENPRVGGSTPSLGTIPSIAIILGAVGADLEPGNRVERRPGLG